MNYSAHRQWLGKDAPPGVFPPQGYSSFIYICNGCLYVIPLSTQVLFVGLDYSIRKRAVELLCPALWERVSFSLRVSPVCD